MSAVNRMQATDVFNACEIPEALSGRQSPVFLHNAPDGQAGSGNVSDTRPLRELIQGVMPLVWHLAERHGLSERAVQLFYANPKDSLVYNTQRMLKLMQHLRHTNHILVPFSSSHSMIFHTLRQIVPCAQEMQLDDVSLFYIGDQANRNALQAISSTCDMSFYFHAQY